MGAIIEKRKCAISRGLTFLEFFIMEFSFHIYYEQYTPEEYEKCRDFGHSTYEQAALMQQRAGIKQMLLVHHAPNHSDAFMDDLQHMLEKKGYSDISFAREGFRTIIHSKSL